MPREAFNNLNPRKKKKIFLAAKKAFTEKPYEEVSITQVITNAGISRGSFYLYFENKQDLYFYVLSNNRKKLIEKFILDVALQKTIFETFKDLFEELIKYIKEEDPKFIERAIMNLNPQTIFYYIDGLKELNSGKLDFSLFGDYGQIKINNQSEFSTILEILTTITITEYCFVLLNRYSIDEARLNLERKFNLIRNSIYKN